MAQDDWIIHPEAGVTIQKSTKQIRVGGTTVPGVASIVAEITPDCRYFGRITQAFQKVVWLAYRNGGHPEKYTFRVTSTSATLTPVGVSEQPATPAELAAAFGYCNVGVSGELEYCYFDAR